jgi:hypothetical protein
MPKCNFCGAPAQFNYGKCSYCNKENQVRVDQLLDNVLVKGLDAKEREWHYNLIKGRIAETLIQELFLCSKYKVYRYGMEHTMPGISQLLRDNKSDVASQIRKMPDFVVQKEKAVFFIEVKFRLSETFKMGDLDQNYPYNNAYIIVVSKKHIKCISIDELKVGRGITPESSNHLHSRKEFELDKAVVNEFCKFAVQFFANV